MVGITDKSSFFAVHKIFKKREIKYKSGRFNNSHRAHGDRNEHQEENYSFPDVQADENDRRFREKYTDRNAQRGRRANLKHTNRINSKKVNAINHVRVFAQTREHFERYCNPLKATFQHWQANELDEFLDRMAASEGQPRHKVKIMPDINRRTQEIAMMHASLNSLFAEINQRVFSHSIDFSQLEIGNAIVSRAEMASADRLREQQDEMGQQMRALRQSINFAELSNGLEINSGDVSVYEARLRRMVNEKRFRKQLAEATVRTQLLSELSNEALSSKLLRNQNLRVNETATSKNPQFVKFEAEHLNDAELKKAILKFNILPSENFLLQCGHVFVKRCCEFDTNNNVNMERLG